MTARSAAGLTQLPSHGKAFVPKEVQSVSSQKRAVSVLFTDEEYAKFVRRAAEMTLDEGRRVSVAELIRRLVLHAFDNGRTPSRLGGRAGSKL